MIGEINKVKKIERYDWEKKSGVNNFVDLYKNFYFYHDDEKETPKIEDYKCPNNVNRSCYWIEKIIMDILHTEKDWTKKDVIRILAWKTGNINHRKAEEDKNNPHCFQNYYYKDWSEDECYIKLKKCKKQKMDSFAEIIIKLRKEYASKIQKPGYCKDSNKRFSDVASSVWKILVEKNDIAGIGPVILLTLLFFITKGECPIYDRFAMAALLSIDAENSKKNEKGDHNIIYLPGDIIYLESLPEKGDDKFKGLLANDDSIYCKYYDLLKKYFDKEIINRNVDRALWVYGHIFNPIQ